MKAVLAVKALCRAFALAIALGWAANGVWAKPYTFVAFHDQDRIGIYDHGSGSWLTPVVVGNGPVGIAVDATQRKAYVTNHRSNSVSIFLIANRAVVATIALASSAQPMGIVVSPTQARAYVANFGNNTVTVVNTLTNTAAANIPVGALPTGLAITPAGDRVFVTNTGDNTISVIDATSNVVVQTLPVALPDNPQPRPYAIAFAPGGSGRLVVANNNGATASIYDGTSYAPLSNIALDAQPTALGVVNGNKVMALNSASATLSIIDPFAGSAASPVSVPAGAISLAVAPDASLASITIAPSRVAAINTTTNAVASPVVSPVTFASALTLGGFVTNPSFECALDLNVNGAVDNDDIVMVARYLLGLRGAALTNGFSSLNAVAIEAQLAAFDLDADGDSLETATTDAVLIARASRGIVGNALIANARNSTVGSPPLRSASLILQWILDMHGANCLP